MRQKELCQAIIDGDAALPCFIGVTNGEWPVHLFETEDSAIEWIKGNARRRLWSAGLVLQSEVALHIPKPHLVEVEQ